MAEPSHRAYSVIKREGKEDFWLNVGVAFPHEDGEGFNPCSTRSSPAPARSSPLPSTGCKGTSLCSGSAEAVIGGGANQPDVPSPAPRARALTLRFG
jgi:hypothetical protein